MNLLYQNKNKYPYQLYYYLVHTLKYQRRYM